MFIIVQRIIKKYLKKYIDENDLDNLDWDGDNYIIKLKEAHLNLQFINQILNKDLNIQLLFGNCEQLKIFPNLSNLIERIYADKITLVFTNTGDNNINTGKSENSYKGEEVDDDINIDVKKINKLFDSIQSSLIYLESSQLNLELDTERESNEESIIPEGIKQLYEQMQELIHNFILQIHHLEIQFDCFNVNFYNLTFENNHLIIENIKVLYKEQLIIDLSGWIDLSISNNLFYIKSKMNIIHASTTSKTSTTSTHNSLNLKICNLKYFAPLLKDLQEVMKKIKLPESDNKIIPLGQVDQLSLQIYINQTDTCLLSGYLSNIDFNLNGQQLGFTCEHINTDHLTSNNLSLDISFLSNICNNSNNNNNNNNDNNDNNDNVNNIDNANKNLEYIFNDKATSVEEITTPFSIPNKINVISNWRELANIKINIITDLLDIDLSSEWLGLIKSIHINQSEQSEQLNNITLLEIHTKSGTLNYGPYIFDLHVSNLDMAYLFENKSLLGGAKKISYLKQVFQTVDLGIDFELKYYWLWTRSLIIQNPLYTLLQIIDLSKDDQKDENNEKDENNKKDEGDKKDQIDKNNRLNKSKWEGLIMIDLIYLYFESMVLQLFSLKYLHGNGLLIQKIELLSNNSRTELNLSWLYYNLHMSTIRINKISGNLYHEFPMNLINIVNKIKTLINLNLNSKNLNSKNSNNPNSTDNVINSILITDYLPEIHWELNISFMIDIEEFWIDLYDEDGRRITTIKTVGLYSRSYRFGEELTIKSISIIDRISKWNCALKTDNCIIKWNKELSFVNLFWKNDCPIVYLNVDQTWLDLNLKWLEYSNKNVNEKKNEHGNKNKNEHGNKNEKMRCDCYLQVMQFKIWLNWNPTNNFLIPLRDVELELPKLSGIVQSSKIENLIHLLLKTYSPFPFWNRILAGVKPIKPIVKISTTGLNALLLLIGSNNLNNSSSASNRLFHSLRDICLELLEYGASINPTNINSRNVESSQISIYADQPANIAQGCKQAIEEVKFYLQLIDPQNPHFKLRRIPLAFIGPITGSIQKILLGLCNTIDPPRKNRMDIKYGKMT